MTTTITLPDHVPAIPTIDMAEELDAATNLLNSALDHYSKTCYNLRIHYRPGSTGRIEVPSDFAKRVLQELPLVKSYETEIQESKAVVNRLHNFSGSTNPQSIFSLPTDVLARIFQTVCNTHPCPQSAMYAHPGTYKPPPFAMDPIVLSHVCSLWRETAINSTDLWSHIDLVPNQFQVPRYLDRANTYLARSGQALLDIHIVQTSKNNDWEETPPADPSFIEFLTVAAPRMRSLTMSASKAPIKGTFYHSVLSTCFVNCVPGRLVHLDLSFARSALPGDEHGPDSAFAGLPDETPEALWHQVKTLYLNQFYPVWTSKVYHGLVELNLGGRGFIPESGLAAILKSSPGLRVFKISLRVTRLSPQGTRVAPVSLVDLEQLSVNSVEEPQIGYVLRLIAPGSKPLGLTIGNPWLGSTVTRRVKFTSRPEVKSFLARANVTRLYACNFDTYGQLAYILAMAPSVRVLILDGCWCQQVSEDGYLPPDFTLDELYVIRSTKFGAVNWSAIEEMAEKHHIRKLTLWWYDHHYNGRGEPGEAVVPDNLYTVCPTVNVVSDESPNPIEDWK